MNKKNIAFIARIIFALFLAIQAWVWLRYAGAFWLSDSLEFMEYLLKSVSPLKISTDAFLILVIPTLLVSFFANRIISIKMRIVIYALLGGLYSELYLLSMAKSDIVFMVRQIWVYSASGCMAGLTYAAILDIPWTSAHSSGDRDTVSPTRRKLLGSLGLFTGTAGFLGALAGPIYFLKNRNTYIDVDLVLLEDGQLMTVEIANKPVWILKRSPDVIQLLKQNNQQLLDPHSEFSQQPEQARNNLRSIRPEYLVVYGICTHLGCSPSYRPDGRASEEPRQNPDPQFFCPCHGGVFDLAGRVYKGTPPPKNMVVPDHEFVSEKVVRLYFPSLAEEWNKNV
jgi:ubiquinol-cytochrome c reductase iron-sulfur subunit